MDRRTGTPANDDWRNHDIGLRRRRWIAVVLVLALALPGVLALTSLIRGL